MQAVRNATLLWKTTCSMKEPFLFSKVKVLIFIPSLHKTKPEEKNDFSSQKNNNNNIFRALHFLLRKIIIIITFFVLYIMHFCIFVL